MGNNKRKHLIICRGLVCLLLSFTFLTSCVIDWSSLYTPSRDLDIDTILSQPLNLTEFCLTSKISSLVLGAEPEEFCRTRGAGTALENGYHSAELSADGDLILQLTDSQIQQWKNASELVQLLQKIVGEDVCLVTEIIPPTGYLYDELYECAYPGICDISEDFTQIIVKSDLDALYWLPLQSACLLMQVLTGVASEDALVTVFIEQAEGNLTEYATIPTYFYIFESLEDCRELITYQSSPSEIEIYDTPESDPYYNAYEYDGFWGMNYCSDNLEYEIFAYEFAAQDTALNYYIVAENDRNLDELLSENDSDTFSYGQVIAYSDNTLQITVLEECRVYNLTAPLPMLSTIRTMLSEVFPRRVES